MVLSGSYPSLYLTRFKPVIALKGIIKFRTKSWSVNVRKVLVVTQFSLSLILIICTMVIFGQVHYMNNMELGFNKENIVCLNVNRKIELRYETVKNELLRHSDIIGVTIKDILPLHLIWNATVQLDGKILNEQTFWELTGVDYNFIDFFNLQIIEGTILLLSIPLDIISLTRNITLSTVRRETLILSSATSLFLLY